MFSDRGLATTGTATLALSTAFAVVAALAPAGWFPAWLGAVDVGLAFVVVALAMWIDARGQGRTSAAAALSAVGVYRGLAVVPLTLLAVFFVAGGVVRGLIAPTSGSSSGCVAVTRELAKAIIQNPSHYYVNVHNSIYPAGALRGQLGD